MSQSVVGWVSAYDNPYRSTAFTKDRKKALVERIRKRRYNFGHFDHEMLPYAAPYYEDGVFCILSKAQWDDVVNEAYKDFPRGARLMPQDVITTPSKNGVLYEKNKFGPKEDEDNV